MFGKKLLAAGFGVFSGLMLAAGSANAASVASSILTNQVNQWSDNSAESQGVDVNGNGFLDEGDTLRGIFQIETREDLTGGQSPVRVRLQRQYRADRHLRDCGRVQDSGLERH